MKTPEEEIRKLAISQLSKETGVADYFVQIDLHDEFVSRCIKIALEYASQFKQPEKQSIENEIIFYNLIPEKGDFIPIITNWLAYKRQKRETYKPIGLKTLIKKFNQFEGTYSELESIVENSIMNNYSGIIWKLKNVNGKPEKRTFEQAARDYLAD